jgi:hypothetical protein
MMTFLAGDKMFFLSAPAKYKHPLQQVQCEFPTKITMNQFEDVLDITVDEPALLVLLAATIAKAS